MESRQHGVRTNTPAWLKGELDGYRFFRCAPGKAPAGIVDATFGTSWSKHSHGVPGLGQHQGRLPFS